jgi:hypothetical protein
MFSGVQPRSSVSRAIVRAVLLAGLLVVALALPATASALRFNTPEVSPTGPEEMVFDWSRSACEPLDIPDASVRAFRDANNQIQLLASHYITRRMIGPTTRTVQHDCNVLMRSHNSSDPSLYQDKEWITSTYTPDGNTIYALVHDEYQGWAYSGMCPGTPTGTFNTACWWNAITAAISTDGGRTYRQVATAPNNLVATVPYRYAANQGPAGAFEASNIIHRGDYYYSMIRVEAIGAQQQGTCLMRTNNLADWKSWRAWDGSGYNVRFINPYVEVNENPALHVCKPVSPTEIATLVDSLTWNRYLKKYLLVGNAGIYDPALRRTVWGVYYSKSSDLIHWTPRRLLMEAELRWTFDCNAHDEEPISTPAVLGPGGMTRNFGTTGRRMYLYFTRNHYSGCALTLDRDLVRIPIQFN